MSRKLAQMWRLRPPGLRNGSRRATGATFRRRPRIRHAGVERRPESLSNERRQLGLRGVSPADAEPVAGRVGIDLMALLGIEVGRRLKEAGSELNRHLVRATGVHHVEIEVHLLLLDPHWPFGHDVVRRELHADTPLSGRIEHAVPVVIPNDDSTGRFAVGLRRRRLAWSLRRKRRTARDRCSDGLSAPSRGLGSWAPTSLSVLPCLPLPPRRLGRSALAEGVPASQDARRGRWYGPRSPWRCGVWR